MVFCLRSCLLQSWKKRFFVLKSGRLSGDPNVLEYFKYQTSKKPIKTINLNDCTQIDINVTVPIKIDRRDTSEHFIFSIVTCSRTFYLIADSLREMSTWVQCLCDLCGFNHDSGEKGDLGRQKHTYKASQPANHTLNDSVDIPTVLTAAPTVDSGTVSHPVKPVTALSLQSSQQQPPLQNGTVNSCFTHPSQDGYEDSHQKSDWNFQSLRRHELEDMADVTLLTRPTLESDPSGYLHLADCDTGPCDIDSAFLSVDKADNRRSSTDSVFAHDDATNESKEDESVAVPIIMVPKSRFLQDVGGGRLDSMPTVPPPPPPTDIPRHKLYYDDDDNNVADARRKPSFLGGQPCKLPPIDDTNLYNVPPGLQRDHRFIDEAHVRQTGSNNSSSHGSVYGNTGRYSASLMNTPDYINTQTSLSSESLSASAHFSGSSISSSGHLSTSPAHFVSQIYDFPSQLSPVFPITKSPCPPYQTPQPLERNAILRKAPSNMLDKNETAVKEQLKNINMLDVGLSKPSLLETVYTSANDVKLQRPNDHQVYPDSEGTYEVPPLRPPKPSGNHADSSESLYSSPRNHEPSSSIITETPTYDTIKQQSSLSLPHTTIMSETTSNSPNSQKIPHSVTRNAISASNSPLATPNMSRKIEINKVPSFTSRLSPLVQINKAVSGSAPSLYDVPQRLTKSPALQDEIDNSGSAEGICSKDDTNIYDQPRKLSDVSRLNPLAQNGSISNVDDVSHPSYEKMASPQLGFFQDELNSYTTMAGVNSTSSVPITCLSQVPPIRHLPSRLLINQSPQDIPPPVHRDLKPGRRSLGSDGGSSQTGLDYHKKNSRDSFGSDDAVSPPHTSVTHTIVLTSEQKQFSYGCSLGPRSSSITSPQHLKFGRNEDVGSRPGFSPNPPNRPPKASFSSASPRSPPMPASPNQLPSRPYTPAQVGSHITIQPGHDLINKTGLPPAPERPPKPASMRFTHTSKVGREGMLPKRPPKSNDDQGFIPARPPKPSVKTPSTGDSLASAGSMQSSFFPSYGPSSVVPPPLTVDHMERELKYIEISTAQGNAQINPVEQQQDRGVVDGPVEYIQLDVEKTRALEKMKKERQSKFQQNSSRGKD